MDSEKENPLEELYIDADDFDRERIKESLSGLIGIDRGSGQPRFHNEFEELGTDEKFTVLLLYRRALDSLDDIDEDENIGESSSYFANYLSVDSSTVRNKVSDLYFVENDDSRGGYFIPSHKIQQAVKLIEEKDDE